MLQGCLLTLGFLIIVELGEHGSPAFVLAPFPNLHKGDLLAEWKLSEIRYLPFSLIKLYLFYKFFIIAIEMPNYYTRAYLSLYIRST